MFRCLKAREVLCLSCVPNIDFLASFQFWSSTSAIHLPLNININININSNINIVSPSPPTYYFTTKTRALPPLLQKIDS